MVAKGGGWSLRLLRAAATAGLLSLQPGGRPPPVQEAASRLAAERRWSLCAATAGLLQPLQPEGGPPPPARAAARLAAEWWWSLRLLHAAATAWLLPLQPVGGPPPARAAARVRPVRRGEHVVSLLNDNMLVHCLRGGWRGGEASGYAGGGGKGAVDQV